MSVDRSSPPLSVELSTPEKALPSQNGLRNHRTPSSPNDESRSVQEPVINKPVREMLKRYCRIVTVSIVIAIMWGMLALPIVFYYSRSQGQVCIEADMCTSEHYTGSICREVLRTQQSCLPDRNTTSFIFIATDPTVSQLSKEEEANQLIRAILSQSPSSKCVEELIPFLCFYIFPLCGNSGRLYQPSVADCSIITNGTCANKTNIFREDECQTLPEMSTTLKCNATDDHSTVLGDLKEIVNTTYTSNTSAVERVCSDGFYMDKSSRLCVPECLMWMEFSNSKSTAIDIVYITSAIVYLVCGTAVVVLSCINHKRILSFPTIFIVYSVIALGVPELLIIIGYSDRTSLYCSSRDLLISVMNGTQFCTVQGLVFTYAVLVKNLFWLFHIVILFWGIKFPFHAKSFETRGHFKYIHIAMVVLAISLPCGHIAAVVATGGVTIVRFPPLYCVARDADATLYSFIFPMCIISGAGTSLLLMIMWSLITTLLTQRKQAKISGIKKVNNISTAKVKVQIVLLYFLIIALFSLPNFTFSALDGANFMEKLITYFDCESQGIQPDRTCERMFDRATSEIINSVSSILFALYPVASLLYIINFQNMKNKLIWCLAKWKQLTEC